VYGPSPHKTSPLHAATSAAHNHLTTLELLVMCESLCKVLLQNLLLLQSLLHLQPHLKA
jgi:hypothetical protein